MYWIPLLIIAVVCVIGIAWSPIFAIVLAIPALLAFFLFVGLSPRADEPAGGTGGQAGADRASTRTEGVWGERQS